MDEAETKPRTKSSSVLWVLVLVALAALWWWYRPGQVSQATHEPDGATEAEIAADRAAALGTDPDDILVDLRDDVSDATVAGLERDLGIDLVLISDQSLDDRFYRAHVDAAQRDALLATLSARADVEVAEPDSMMSLPPGAMVEIKTADAAWEGFPDDPKYKYQWHLRQIGMPDAWKLADGNGIVVAVLDTGVAYEKFERYHQVEDLEGLTFVEPYDFVDNDKHANDGHGHGTHVTGTIAQATHNGKGVAGVARNVKIMPLKVLDASGRGSVAGIADAIRYSADKGAKVINMSLGGPFPSRALKKAVEYAVKKGVTVVAAAGNDGRNKVGYPAAYDGVVAVASTQFDESTTFYSNYGKDIDIAAPGGNTRVDQNGDGEPDGVLQNTIVVGDPTKSGYYAFMGTSMASPHVAGVAALVVGEGITDPVEVERVLQETARRPASQKYDRDKYGAGIIDAPAAVRKAQADKHAVASAALDSGPTRGTVELVLALLVAGAVAASTRKRGVNLGPSYLAGAVAGAGGMALLGLLGLALDGNALIQSAMVPLVLLMLGYGAPKLRAPLAGVAAGAAAHLLFLAVVGTDLRWVPSVFVLDQLWLAANALLCIALAKTAIRR